MSSAACSFGSYCTCKETSSEEEVPGGRSHSSRAGVEGRPVSWKSQRSVVPFAFTLSRRTVRGGTERRSSGVLPGVACGWTCGRSSCQRSLL